jgi:hypothetical protein
MQRSHRSDDLPGLLTDTRRFGFSHIVSSGNEATVSAAADAELGHFRILPAACAGAARRAVG